jgi:hypothetical protein
MGAATVPRTIASERAGRRRRRHGVPASVPSQSLLDVVDNLIDKGLVLDTEVVLGLADIDLIYLRAGALLAAADRVFPRTPATRRRIHATTASGSPNSATPLAAHATHAVASPPARSNAKSCAAGPMATAADDASRSVIRLVLTLVEFVRQLLERQTVRRVRERTLTAEEIERLGTALMRLETTVHELAHRHGLDPADLNLDLGPLGTLR